jgi:hypothetical protein
MKKIIAGILAAIGAMSITACAAPQSFIPPESSSTPNAAIGRKAYIESLRDEQAPDTAGVENFIGEMNGNLAKSLRLDSYSIEQGEHDGVFVVRGDDYSITVQTDENGNVQFASCSADNGVTKQTVTEALLDTLWPMDMTPPDFREKMAIKQMESWAGSDALFAEVRRFNGEEPLEGGRTMPEPGDLSEADLGELPGLDVELSDEEKQNPKEYTPDNLKEPTVSKPVGAKNSVSDLPDVGNFGKIPERNLP